MLLDIPNVPMDAVNWFQSNLSIDERVAFNTPYLKINKMEIGASCAVAGIMNRLDKTAGIWSSPSGQYKIGG